jgi:hypothetical protein
MGDIVANAGILRFLFNNFGMTMKNFICIWILSATLCGGVFAQSENSMHLSMASREVLTSPLLSLEGKPIEASKALGIGGLFVVGGLVVGSVEVTTLTIKSIATGSEYIVKASTKAVKGASVGIGASVQVTAESTGYALVATGKLLAFIPNAIGQLLLHQSKVK